MWGGEAGDWGGEEGTFSRKSPPPHFLLPQYGGMREGVACGEGASLKLADSPIFLDERREKLIQDANEEARRILREAKETADQTIRSINKIADTSGIGKQLEAERTKLREKMNSVDEKLSSKAQKTPKKAISPKTLKIGDGVRVLTMNLNGTVSTLPNAKGDLYVQMGILRSLVNIKDLELLDEASVTGPGLESGGKGGGKRRDLYGAGGAGPGVHRPGPQPDTGRG